MPMSDPLVRPKLGHEMFEEILQREFSREEDYSGFFESKAWKKKNRFFKSALQQRYLTFYRPYQFTGPLLPNQCGLIPIFDHLSEYNAQHFEYTNRDGHVYGAYCDIYIKSDKLLTGQVIGIQNSWKMRSLTILWPFSVASL